MYRYPEREVIDIEGYYPEDTAQDQLYADVRPIIRKEVETHFSPNSGPTGTPSPT